mgnify:CR=1 FL=1
MVPNSQPCPKTKGPKVAYYHPCKNCAVDTSACERRAEIRDAISGLHVTSVKFECKKREPLFRSGQRVKFSWSHWEQSDYDGSGCENKLVFSGTVVAEKGTKFIVRVDDAEGVAADEDYEDMDPKHVFQNQRLVVKVKPCDMLDLGEPDKPMCETCLAYNADEAERRCHGYNDGAWYVYHPQGCLVDKSDLK